MIYDFNVDLKDLSGAAIMEDKKPLTIGKLLARSLANQAKGDSLKLYGWAMKMYNCEKLNLDKSDIKVLTEFVESSEAITILAKGQIMELLTAAKTEK
jgi:hypothetical protein